MKARALAGFAFFRSLFSPGRKTRFGGEDHNCDHSSHPEGRLGDGPQESEQKRTLMANFLIAITDKAELCVVIASYPYTIDTGVGPPPPDKDLF